MVLWRPTRPSRTNTKKRCPFHHRGLECKSRKSRDTWSNRQVCPWSTKWSRAKANRILLRECSGHSKTLFHKHKKWLYTGTSPDGQYQSQIDYICSQRCCGWWLQPWSQKMIDSWQECRDKPRQCVEKQRYSSAKKRSLESSLWFSIWLWELDRKEGRLPKNWCLQTVALEKTLRVPWTARRSSQSMLREINPEYSLEGLMLKLKLHYFGHLMWTANSLVKSLMLEKIEGRRRRGHQRMRCLAGITNAMDMNLGKLWKVVRDRKSWHASVHCVTESDPTGQLNTKNTLFTY